MIGAGCEFKMLIMLAYSYAEKRNSGESDIDGCGGPQPVHHAVHVLPAEPFGSDFRWAKAA